MAKRPKARAWTRAELQAEIEELSEARYDLQCRVSAMTDDLVTERRIRRAAEDASAEALRKQRAAEERLIALLDRFLGRTATGYTYSVPYVDDRPEQTRG